jgi:hypothetical protein
MSLNFENNLGIVFHYAILLKWNKNNKNNIFPQIILYFDNK